MTKKIDHTEDAVRQQHCVIKVVGVGGGGCNAVNSMIRMGIEDVEFYVLNTDVQHLNASECANKIHIGRELTRGLGCGGDPEIGRQAAEAARDEIMDMLSDANMVFITAGLGAGAGTGAAPVVAEAARELGILTVAIVTRPFKFEGPMRMRRAEEGLARLREASDSIIVVSNDRLLEVAGAQASLLDSFELANQVLGQGVMSISEMISRPALIKVDFADVRSMVQRSGGAILGIGQGSGEERAAEAVRHACSSPLLDKTEVTGARKVLISFAGPANITLHEVYDAASQVQQLANASVDLVFGVRIDDTLDNTVKVTILATGFEDAPEDAKSKAVTTSATATAAAPAKPAAVKEPIPLASAVDREKPAPAGKAAISTPAPVKILTAPPQAPAPRKEIAFESNDVIQLPEDDVEIPLPRNDAPRGTNGKIHGKDNGGPQVIALDTPAAEIKPAKAPAAAAIAETPSGEFSMTEDLKEVLARWDKEDDGDEIYSPFAGPKETPAPKRPEATLPPVVAERELVPVVAPTPASAPVPGVPMVAAAGVKGANGKPSREKAAVKTETSSDIFDVIDKAKGETLEPAVSGALHDGRKPRLDATRPDPKPEEEDLEIPAFLRRRRSGFRIF